MCLPTYVVAHFLLQREGHNIVFVDLVYEFPTSPCQRTERVGKVSLKIMSNSWAKSACKK